MQPFKNAMSIFQLLEKSNCRDCGEKTCLAFAGAVYTNRRRLADCPRLAPEILEKYQETENDLQSEKKAQADELYIADLKRRLADLDLQEAADRVGGRYEGGRLILKVMGKDFGINREGAVFTDLHVNPMIMIPFLMHILHGKGVIPTGEWRSLRELNEGREMYPLFQKRCEEPLKLVADTYPDLFEDMVHIFSGRQVEPQFQSDVSVVLSPLPRVPVMICYWLPDEGMESSLNFFFDRTADRNLDIGSLFGIGSGLAQMFGKLAQRHGI